jgi:hypothetical protein
MLAHEQRSFFFPLISLSSSLNSSSLKPFLPTEDDDRDEGDEEHDEGMNPERIRMIAERYGCAHREHIRIHRHREKHGGENREHLHREVELVREERIVRGFERFDRLLTALEDIPDADIRSDEILKIHAEVVRNERVIVRDERFQYGPLRLQCPTEIKDVPFGDGDLVHHLESLIAHDHPFISDDLRVYFQDLIGTNIRIWNILESSKETIEALEATNNSLLSNKLDLTMKVLTIFSAVLLPMSVYTNMLAMSASIPFGNHPNAFWIHTFIMLLIALITVVIFRWKKWF